MFATGVTMGLAEWIIDDTCLVKLSLKEEKEARSLEMRSERKDGKKNWLAKKPRRKKGLKAGENAGNGSDKKKRNNDPLGQFIFKFVNKNIIKHVFHYRRKDTKTQRTTQERAIRN